MGNNVKIRKLLGVIGSTLLGSMFLVTSAQATLILSISDGTDTETVTDLDDNGAVLYIGSIGDWILNITIGVADPYIGDNNSSRLDLSSLNVTGSSESGGSLYISLTDTDNNVPIGDTGFSIDVGGTTGGSISFQSYVDSGNTPFGTGTLLYDTGILSGGAFSTTGNGSVTVDGPYSITTIATIVHGDGWSLTGFNHGVEIPEPGSLALLGIGLLGLAFGIRRASREG